MNDANNTEQTQQGDVKRTVAKLSIIAAAMFAFVFVVMVPLYNVLCDITGLNGKTAEQAALITEVDIDSDRKIRISFTATNNEQMPWEFHPGQSSIEIHPGEIVNTHFFAKNTTDRDMVSQSIPSVAPSNAAQYFHKTECFCFNNQPLDAGESAELGLQFYVDKELPKSIKTITLSYTIFDITDIASSNTEVATAN